MRTAYPVVREPARVGAPLGETSLDHAADVRLPFGVAAFMPPVRRSFEVGEVAGVASALVAAVRPRSPATRPRRKRLKANPARLHDPTIGEFLSGHSFRGREGKRDGAWRAGYRGDSPKIGGGYPPLATARSRRERKPSMPKKGDVHVVPSDKGWQVRVEGSSRARSTHSTQANATQAGREVARRNESELSEHVRERPTPHEGLSVRLV
jgi:hypothetical protein